MSKQCVQFMEETKLDSKKKKVTILFAFIIVISIVGVVVFVGGNSGRELKKQLDLGHKYLTELDYEQAIASFKAAIAIDPMNEEAYLGMADAYLGKGDLEDAKAVLGDAIKMFEENGLDTSKLQEKLDEIQNEIDRIAEEEKAKEEQEFMLSLTGLKDAVEGACGQSGFAFDAYTWEQRKELCHPLIKKVEECIAYCEERHLEVVYIPSDNGETTPFHIREMYDRVRFMYLRCGEMDTCYEAQKRIAERFETPEILNDGYEVYDSVLDKYGRAISHHSTDPNFGELYDVWTYFNGNLLAGMETSNDMSSSSSATEYDDEGRQIKHTTVFSDGASIVSTYVYEGDAVIVRTTHSNGEKNEQALQINVYGYAYYR